MLPTLGQHLKHDVFRLQITMDNSPIVDRIQCPGDLPQNLGCALELHSFLSCRGTKGDTLDKLHHKKRLAAGCTSGIKHADHSRMIDPGQGFDLLLELPKRPGSVFDAL